MKNVPGTIKRVLMKADLSLKNKKVEYEYGLTSDEIAETVDQANIVTSSIDGQPGMHAPVIDLDFPHTYVPSSTPGHGHLYIDTPMDEETFWLFLETLADVGVIEEGYFKVSKKRGYSAVRLPWIKKENHEKSNGY